MKTVLSIVVSILLALLLYSVYLNRTLHNLVDKQDIKIQTLHLIIEKHKKLIPKYEWLSEPIYWDKQTFLKDYQENDLEVEANLTDHNTVYRLIYSAAFCSSSYIYKISNQGDTSFTFSKTYLLFPASSKGLTDMPKVKNMIKVLDQATWKALQQKIEQSMFWSLERRDDRLGYDGHTYTLEGALKKGHYFNHKEVYRWAPRGGCFLELCEYIMAIGDDPAHPCY